MGRTSRDRGDRFRPPPVQRIELNEKFLGRRFVAAAVLLVFGAVVLAFAVTQFLAPPSGWQTIEANGTGEASCAEDLTFLYEAGSSMEAKAAKALYTNACQRAYRLFQCYEEFEGVVNICTLNRSPNQVFNVDVALYEALATVTANGHRELYLGPVYARYNDLFFCQDDSQLVNYDPRLSEDVAREYQEVLAYANDPQSVDIELLGENQVCLRVSEDYLTYAGRMGIERFIDFGWTANAFIVDLVAGDLAAEGYVNGALSSCDGFTCNLDSRAGTYDYPIYHRREDLVSYVASLRYGGPMSLVCLRDFAVGERDAARFYRLQSGEVRTVYLDPADALCKNAVSSLICYSQEKSCGEILMEMISLYVADSLREEDVAALTAEGIESVYCERATVRCTEAGAVQVNVDSGYVAELLRP